MLEVAKDQKDIMLENKSNNDAFEFKPNFKVRPKTENLDCDFADEKTLRQTLIETLKDFDKLEEKENVSYDIDEILSVEPKKFFKKYFCIFYKNKDEEERILAIDKNYNKDTEATKLFDRLLKEDNFNENINQKAKDFKENKEKFESFTPQIIEEKLAVDLTDGKTIETSEHKKYLKYVLKNAKQEIFLQSPWVRNKILEIYKNDIDEAIKRGIKITIKYGIKPEVSIDEKSNEYLNKLDKKMFKLIKGNDHSKILICDDEFMIIGSFNWLSFGGEKDKDGNTRGETSTINKNKDEIKIQKDKFNANSV